jgi:transposase
MWCVPTLDKEYVGRMEDLLDLYEKPLDPREPVVCLDERPVQLLDFERFRVPCGPGRIAKQDYEYVRCGTANLFCTVEPKAGRHSIKATPNRKGPAFAERLLHIAKKYRRAKTIHLVVDNLNTHAEKSLVESFGATKGRRLWKRFTVHYTPKHGSWLNQAEIEISLVSRQCLGGRRISTLEQLSCETTAWEREANRQRIKIRWTFTTRKARRKLGYHAVDFRRSED